ncbi:hypothetical protein MFLAVUS_009558 [Mucor flavus]|uniref:Uncharacterized protein n=1 Tax=Mucor flavus TaxID=439312 RepID=A0ABP9ZAC4_9FUNG
MDESSSNKTVRERADAIERLESSFSKERTKIRRSNILPSYSRSTASSLKRASMSGSTDTNSRLNKLRRLNSSPHRASSPTPSEVSSVSRDDATFDAVALYVKVLQNQFMTHEIEQAYNTSERKAKKELAALEKELKELDAEEISQNKLDNLCKQITSCMGRIDTITKGGDNVGDLDKEKQILVSILPQLNVPTNNSNLLNEFKTLINAIIEA